MHIQTTGVIRLVAVFPVAINQCNEVVHRVTRVALVGIGRRAWIGKDREGKIFGRARARIRAGLIVVGQVRGIMGEIQ